MRSSQDTAIRPSSRQEREREKDHLLEELAQRSGQCSWRQVHDFVKVGLKGRQKGERGDK